MCGCCIMPTNRTAREQRRGLGAFEDQRAIDRFLEGVEGRYAATTRRGLWRRQELAGYTRRKFARNSGGYSSSGQAVGGLGVGIMSAATAVDARGLAAPGESNDRGLPHARSGRTPDSDLASEEHPGGPRRGAAPLPGPDQFCAREAGESDGRIGRRPPRPAMLGSSPRWPLRMGPQPRA